MDSRYLTKEFVIEFLEMYKSLECLWKIKSRDYANRQKRDKAYDLLIQKLKQVDPSASRMTVVKKIDSFRGGFRKELKKIEKSKLTAQNPEEIYKPKLWYFEHLLFLIGQEPPEKSDLNFTKIKNEEFENEITEGEEYYLETEYETLEDPQTTDDVPILEENHDTSQTVNFDGSQVKRKKVDDSPQYVLKRISSNFDIEEDEFSIMGKNIANKLRKLTPEQATIAEKLITDILFEAKIGNIDKNSRIIIQDVTSNQNQN